MIPGTFLAPFEVHAFSKIAGARMSTPSAPRDAGEAPDPWICVQLLNIVHQNPDVQVQSLLQSDSFDYAKGTPEPSDASFAEFEV
jgi:hypothetical protein